MKEKYENDAYEFAKKESKSIYASEPNETFNWQEYDERLPEFENLIICNFKLLCVNGTDNKLAKLPIQSIPSYYPKLLKDFYQKCAPVRLIVGDVIFWRYDLAFELANKVKGQVIPIAYKGKITNSSSKNFIYIDKNLDGIGYDQRIQLDVGNQKVQILGSNIFTFLARLADSKDTFYE